MEKTQSIRFAFRDLFESMKHEILQYDFCAVDISDQDLIGPPSLAIRFASMYQHDWESVIQTQTHHTREQTN